MKLRWQKSLDAWRASYFALPMLLALGGLLGAFALIALDQAVSRHALSGWAWVYSGGPDGARTVLSTMASSVLTVAGIAYSITIAALVLASTQFGPRLLRNFIDDTYNQFVLGSFVGTFLFCLVTLRTIRGESEGGAFVPQIAVTVAIALTIVCSLLLVYFFHHVAATIQAPAIVADVSRDLHASIDRLFPRGVGLGRPQNPALEAGHGTPPDLESQAKAIASDRYGYLQAIDVDTLFAHAAKSNCIVKLGFRPGDFVLQSATLAWIYPRERAGAEWENLVCEAFLVGDGRTPLQDVEFGVNQLVEVACRALSPAINDPFTAMACLDHLGSAMTHLLQTTLPSPWRYQGDDLRLIAERISFEGLCDAAFNMIRQYGRDSAAVTIRLLEVLAQIAPHADEPYEKAALRLHAEMTRRDCQSSLPDERDRADVEERYARVLETLR